MGMDMLVVKFYNCKNEFNGFMESIHIVISIIIDEICFEYLKLTL